MFGYHHKRNTKKNAERERSNTRNLKFGRIQSILVLLAPSSTSFVITTGSPGIALHCLLVVVLTITVPSFAVMYICW